MRSWPSTRRSGPVRMRPPRPCGSRHPATSAGADTPAAQTVTSLGRSSPVGQDDPVAAHLPDGGVQPDLHAAGLQLPARVLAQPGLEGQQQGIRLLDQADAHRRQVHLGERGVQRGAAQLGQGAGQLDPGGAAAHHGEVHDLAGTGDVQPFQPGHDVVTQLHRVAAGVQAEAVLGGPAHPVVGRGHPGGEDQVVVVEMAAVRERDPAVRRVHRGDLAQPEPGAVLAGERPGRVGHVARVQPARGHLVEQRLEGAVHVAVDQQNLGSRPVQLLHRGQPREPGPHHDHPRSVTNCLPVRAPPHSCHLGSPIGLPAARYADCVQLVQQRGHLEHAAAATGCERPPNPC